MKEISCDGSAVATQPATASTSARRDVDAVLHPEHVLEQDPQRVREPHDVVARLERVEPEDLAARAADVERRAGAEAVGMRHRLRFKQLGPCQPPEAALRQRRLGRVEVPRDGLAYGRADAARVGGEPLVAQRAQVLRVRVEHVLASDLARRVEEREAHPDRHLEQRALLAVGLREEPLVDGGELGRRGQALRVVAKIGERALQPLDLERRDVDQACGRPARALERGEQVVDGRELRLPGQDACRLELTDERVEVDAGAARDVGRAGEEPER